LLTISGVALKTNSPVVSVGISALPIGVNGSSLTTAAFPAKGTYVFGVREVVTDVTTDNVIAKSATLKVSVKVR
jgi:hypothetical protein